MKPLSKMRLKSFLWMGVPVGIGMAISSEGFNIWMFLFITILLGGILSEVYISSLKSILKRNGIDEYSEETTKSCFKQLVNSKLSKDQLINILNDDRIFGKMMMNEKDGEVNLQSSSKWNWWTTKINIMTNPSNGENFNYQISSIPHRWFPLVDLRNIERIIRIKRLLKVSNLYN